MTDPAGRPYDWDVIVVGGGPAGLSAAIRTRWIKRYKAVPCSTLLLEPSSLGGLVAWRGCFFSGPSWKIDNLEIVRRFSADLRKLHIPVHRKTVTRIEGGPVIKKVHTADGAVYRCLAVVVAAGIKRLVNEKKYLGQGLTVTSMGYEFMVAMIQKLFRENGDKKIVVTGGPKLVNIMPMIRKTALPGQVLWFVVEGKHAETGTDVISGRVDEYLGDERLTGIRVACADGMRQIDCDLVLLDFNSYELVPGHGIVLDSGDGGQPGDTFFRVDADMQTDIPGILAAGDVTQGGYNSFSRAVSQGIAAGLSAYRYVFLRKFGQEPPLFAYRAADFVLEAGYRELPQIDAGMRPVALVDEGDLHRSLGDSWRWLAGRMDGSRTIGQLAGEAHVSQKRLVEMIRQLINDKRITVHVGQAP